MASMISKTLKLIPVAALLLSSAVALPAQDKQVLRLQLPSPQLKAKA